MWFTFFKIHLDFDHFNFHTNCFAECSCKCALIFHKCIAVELLNIIFCFAMFLSPLLLWFNKCPNMIEVKLYISLIPC